MSGSGVGMAGGAAVGISIVGAGVAAGDTAVAVGSAAVAVGGLGVAVGGTAVAVGGAAVGGADVAVGDAGIAVAVGCGSASGTGLRHDAIASVNRSVRHAVANNLMEAGKAFISQSYLFV